MQKKARTISPQSNDEPMPKSEEAERAVLGDVLIESSSIEKVLTFLEPDHFYRTAHQKIFRAMLELHESNTAVDVVTLTEELKRRKEYEDVGGAYYLTRLAGSEVSAVNILDHAHIVKTKAAYRIRIESATRIIENVQNGANEEKYYEMLERLNHSNVCHSNGPIDLASLPDPGPQSFIIEDLIPEGFITNLYGESDQGKSHFALMIAASIISGQKIFGKTAQKGYVLYLDWELDESVQIPRWRKISKGIGYPEPLHGLYYKKITKSFHQELRNIKSWIQESKPILIIIDSVGKALADDPIDPVKVIKMYSSSEELGTVLMIDHQAKQSGDSNYSRGSEFGSVYKRNLARSVLQLQLLENRGAHSGHRLQQKKNNFGRRLTDIHFEMNFEQDSTSLIYNTSTDIAQKPFGVRSSIIEVLEKDKATSDDIFKAIDGGYDEGTIRNEISSLRKEGVVILLEKKGKLNVYGLRASQS
jgi:hypothetical protein